MGARFRSLVGFVGVVALSAAAACTYDFTVAKRAPTSDGGAAADDGGGVTDDAGAAADAAKPDADEVDAGFDCQGFTVGLEQLRDNAVVCSDSDPGACVTTVRDECDCEVGVGKSNGPATLAYREALAMYRDAGCSPASCKSCPRPPDFICEPVGPGATTLCVPF